MKTWHAGARETSVDASIAAVLSQLDDILALKEEKRAALNSFFGAHCGWPGGGGANLMRPLTTIGSLELLLTGREKSDRLARNVTDWGFVQSPSKEYPFQTFHSSQHGYVKLFPKLTGLGKGSTLYIRLRSHWSKCTPALPLRRAVLLSHFLFLPKFMLPRLSFGLFYNLNHHWINLPHLSCLSGFDICLFWTLNVFVLFFYHPGPKVLLSPPTLQNRYLWLVKISLKPLAESFFGGVFEAENQVLIKEVWKIKQSQLKG